MSQTKPNTAEVITGHVLMQKYFLPGTPYTDQHAASEWLATYMNRPFSVWPRFSFPMPPRPPIPMFFPKVQL